MSRRKFRRVPAKSGGSLKACPGCGVALMTAMELAETLDIAHSTVGLRLRKLGIAPQVLEGSRELFVGPVAIAALLRGS